MRARKPSRVDVVPGQEPRRKHRALALVPFLIILALLAIHRPFLVVDTYEIVGGAEAVIRCLARERLVHCRGVTKYPLFQYVPTVVALSAGLTRNETLSVLALLNWAAFVGVLAAGYETARRCGSANAARVAFAVLLSGVLPVYAVSGFGEGLAAGLVLAACASILLGWPGWLQAFLFAAASTTKEIAPLMLVLLAAPCLVVARAWPGTRTRRTLCWVAAGIGLGIACNLLFNVFRYGTAINTAYASSTYRVPSTGLWLNFTAANLVSPNAGLLFFWPLALLAVLLCAVMVACGGAPRWRRTAAVLILGALVAVAAVFGRWWSPFGWVSWGPRFLVPWVPSLCVLSLIVASPEIDRACERATRTLGTAPAALLAAVVVTVLTLPALGRIADGTAYARFFAFGCEACPRMPYAEDWDYYYPCIRHQVWSHHPWLVSASLPGVTTPFGIRLVASVALATLAAFAPGRRRRGAAHQ